MCVIAMGTAESAPSLWSVALLPASPRAGFGGIHRPQCHSSGEGIIQGCPRLEAGLCRAHAQGDILAALA